MNKGILQLLNKLFHCFISFSFVLHVDAQSNKLLLSQNFFFYAKQQNRPSKKIEKQQKQMSGFVRDKTVTNKNSGLMFIATMFICHACLVKILRLILLCTETRVSRMIPYFQRRSVQKLL